MTDDNAGDWEFDVREGKRFEGAIIVCRQGKKALGHVWIRPRRRCRSIYRYAEIAQLEVIESHRRLGIGGELVRRATAWAKENDFERVSVEASAKEPQPAVAFYQSVGFRQRSIILDLEA